MLRSLLCLCFFLFFAFLYPRSTPIEEPASNKGERKIVKVIKPRGDWFGVLTSSPHSGFPASLSWAGLYKTLNTNTDQVEPLPDPDVVTFLEKCLARHEKEVHGYTATLHKRERVMGKLKAPEVVHIEFQEKPHSVFMKWIKGAGDATAAVYVAGKNNDKILAKPRLLPWITWRDDVRGAKAKRSSRYTIDEFGIKKGLERIIKTWKQKKTENKLHAEYEGVFYVAQVGNRPCYKIHRNKFEYPEEDGITDIVIYIDTETWLQIGTTIRGENGQLIAEYFFRDLRLNPSFPDGYFAEGLLSRK